MDNVVSSGKKCILDIDVQGASQVKKSSLNERTIYIFVMPPSVQELEKRLRGRGTETEEKIQKRLQNAQGEMAHSKTPGFWNKVLVNDDIDVAYKEFKEYVAPSLGLK